MTRFEHPFRTVVVAAILAIAVAALGAPPATAQDSTDEAALLAELAVADDAAAMRIDRQLQALWGRSGSAAMDLLLKRGRDALEAGRTDVAIEHLTALVDHAPDFAEGWHARATAYFQAGLYGPAVADLERALALNPNNYNALFGLGAIFETFNDPVRAHEVYLRVRAINPHHAAAVSALERLAHQVEGQTL